MLSIVLTLVHGLLVAGAVAALVLIVVPFIRAAAQREPEPVPPAMEPVDWHSKESSLYCLACHKQVSPAMAGLDVEQGHPQNVALSPAQLDAIRDMGTIAGPDGTLICRSCHKLGADPDASHMLADTLVGSKLCLRCHPEQVPRCDTRHDLRTTAAAEQNRLGQTPEEAGPCSACHLAHYYAREFTPSPLDPDGRCITCHALDRAAAKLARTTMEHPETHCTVCHNPHDDCLGHFLKQPTNELCVTCHKNFDGGVTAGMHPLGQMDHPVPEELVKAGAQTGKDARQMTCLVCHSTHSSVHEPLLVMSPESNDLCLLCHREQLEKLAPGGKLPHHGRQPKLNDRQQTFLRDRGAPVGPGGELLCVSCHRMHEGKADTPLLTFDPRFEDACAACHPKQAQVVGTSHDLRTRFPVEKNVAGVTTPEAGVCSACHMAHRPARGVVAGPGDPRGRCTSCHQKGSCAGERLAGDVTHPDTGCTDCHDPHAARPGHFLSRAPQQLCAECHDKLAQRMSGGPHDRAARPEAWAEASPDVEGLCGACHVAHGQGKAGLLRLAAEGDDSYHDGVCLKCHPDAGWDVDTDRAIIHPHAISPEQKKVPVKLVPVDDAGNLRMGCRTCHDVHGGAEPVHLARVEPDEPTAALCLHCHEQKRHIALTGHAPEKLAKLGFDVDSCKPCHAMHARPSAAWGELLSPRFLMEQCNVTANGGEGCVPCLSCHRADGPAPVREVVTHPDVVLTNIVSPESPGFLPLFNREGKVDPQGQVVCRTCHVSHGRLDLLEQAAADRNLPPDEQRAMRMQLRPFVMPNVCSECHGTDARAKFLFFHNSQHRSQ